MPTTAVPVWVLSSLALCLRNHIMMQQQLPPSGLVWLPAPATGFEPGDLMAKDVPRSSLWGLVS